LGDYKRIIGVLPYRHPGLFLYLYGIPAIKWTLDDMYYDSERLNTNSITMFRYAEVLLNYAEAKLNW